MGWGVVEGTGGQKKRLRGGASKAEGGLWGLRDGWQYSLFPRSPPLLLKLNNRVQAPADWCGSWKKLQYPQKLGSDQKMQISIQINLRASMGMPKRRQLKSCIDLSRPYFLLKVVTQVLPTDCPNKSMCRDLVPGGSLFFLLHCTPYLSGPSCSFAF